MNPASFALKSRNTMVVLLLVLVGAGLLSYARLGKLEDPTFTIKTAMVYSVYPGASPLEVEQEVTDVLEEAIQAMGQVKEIRSTSQEGVSYIYVDVKDTYNSSELPQIWDELRRKVNDAQALLPTGAASVVNDDFSDVYGVFFAVSGEGYSYAELKDYADSLKRELLLCDGVARITIWSVPQEVLYVEMRRARMAELGITPSQIYQTLQAQNLVQPSGKADVDGEWMRITPTGELTDLEHIRDLLIAGGQDLVRLGDVALIERGYEDPLDSLMLFNGRPAIGLGISTVEGGNVVEMGQAVKERLAELEPDRPVGMRLDVIYFQSEQVNEAMRLFMTNLVEAVVIVVILLMVFMGWRSGALIGSVLLFTILGTFVGMYAWHIDLQKISLGALILALGMLVDNAIVVVDSTLVRMQRGEARISAAQAAVRDTQWPLLGATIVAILAFTAIGFAPGNVGEFCRSLFQVMSISLLLSWVLAVTVTPLFCVWFLKTPKQKAGGRQPFDSPMYRIYRGFLHRVLRARWLVVGLVGLCLFVAMAGFQMVPKAFFPDSTQRMFFINYWKPQGTHIDHVIDDITRIEQRVRSMDHVTGVVTVAGQSALRFMLLYTIEVPNTSFGQLMVKVDDYHEIDGLIAEVEQYLNAEYPDAEPFCTKVPTGPPLSMRLEVRFRGPDFEVLRDLAGQAEAIARDSGEVRDLRTDWRQQVRVIRPQFSESQARRAGVTRNDVADALQWNFSGMTVGVFRDGDDLLPIISRPPADERRSVDTIRDVQVFGSLSGQFVPIGQVVTSMEPEWEQPLIPRSDRQRIVTVRFNQASGNADTLRNLLLQDMESIELPLGYSMEWGGEYEKSHDAQKEINRTFPLCLLGMFVIVVWLFNSVRRSLMIFMTLPLALIGVAAALLLTGLPFGFMAILGFLGLSGMLIKNAVVLIDQIEMELKAGTPPYKAVLDSGVSRVRPVTMAAGTTILGMAPLVTDPLYAGMAATIMGGLFAATFLTLFVVPVLYSLFFRVRPDKEHV